VPQSEGEQWGQGRAQEVALVAAEYEVLASYEEANANSYFLVGVARKEGFASVSTEDRLEFCHSVTVMKVLQSAAVFAYRLFFE
jgi:hypothetical protein